MDGEPQGVSTCCMKQIALTSFGFLLGACIIIEPGDDTDTDGGSGVADETGGGPGGGGSTTTTGGADETGAGDGGGDDGGPVDMCLFHGVQFDNDVWTFPAPQPLDSDGNPSSLALSCSSVPENPPSISLASVAFARNTAYYIRTPNPQGTADLVNEFAICGGGGSTAGFDLGEAALWDDFAAGYAAAARSECVDALENEGCVPGSLVAPAVGAFDVCRDYVEYPLYYGLLNFSPPFMTDPPEPQMLPVNPDTVCDFNTLDVCDNGGLDETGGDGTTGSPADNGWSDELSDINCSSGYNFCTHTQDVRDAVFGNLNTLIEDGVYLVQQPNGGGFKIGGVNPTTDTGMLLSSFGLQNGDVLKKLNYKTLAYPDDLEEAFQTASNANRFILKYKRRAVFRTTFSRQVN